MSNCATFARHLFRRGCERDAIAAERRQLPWVKVEENYVVKAYDAPQLHAAFEIYRAIPKNAEWNAVQTEQNSVPLVVAVGEKSFVNALLSTFVEGYRAKGMTHVEGAHIPGAGHYVVADNPQQWPNSLSVTGERRCLAPRQVEKRSIHFRSEAGRALGERKCGSTASPNRRACCSRSSPHSSSMMWVQPAWR